jgi:hypothetical protein
MQRPIKPPPSFCSTWLSDSMEERASAVIVGLSGEVLDQDCVAQNADRLARVIERKCEAGAAWAAREMRKEAERLCP